MSFDRTLNATLDALRALGWNIAEISHPSVFEYDREKESPYDQQVLIFTEIQQTPLFLSSRYTNLNVNLRAMGESTEVEIRYIAITPVIFKSAQSYRNDALVNGIFDRISELLGQR
jgi:xanthine dehydrogenase molybdopterin-binding subunit B